ncbi:MAG: STAS domain-containing protein [Candidatus Muirbacterium halophilum]|nr:STAS domain-containing protein [Candidatus Muirbacterium halophilum]MCK9476277.1 STAS domain-containing protein [Candidatus Muirbacterium halophilum]
MNLVLEKKEEDIIIKIDGEITINNFDQISAMINENIAENIDYILDFENVTYIDSAGMGGLVAKLKEIYSYNSNLRIVHTPAKILKLFKLTKLDKFFEIY